MNVGMKDNERSCYLCGHKGSTCIHHGVRGNPNIDVLKCDSCGLVFLSDFISQNREFYKNGGMRNGSPDRWHGVLAEADFDDDRRFLFTKDRMTNRSILDFGCGAGGYLMKAASVARKAYGIELEDSARTFIDSSMKASPFSTTSWGGVFENSQNLKTAVGNEKLDLITMWHVLEHLEDPVSILRNLAGMLTEDGRIYIEVPNADDALLSLYENEAFADFTYWECHLYLYTAETLKKLLGKAGLKLRFITQYQRYPLSNHLYWLTKGKPGGHIQWNMMRDRELDKSYGNMLAKLGIADTIIAEVSK